MRDFVSCFSENAVNVSHPSCSSYSSTAACISQTQTPSVQNTVTSLYRISLSTQKRHLISVTWCRNHSAQGLTVTFGEDPSAIAFKLDTTSTRFFRKRKGTKIYELDKSKFELFWDLSNAKYEAGPEPIAGFHLLLMVDSEIALVLGEMGEDAFTKRAFKTSSANPVVARSSLVSRREHCSGNTLYSTKAKFCENGISHEIVIRCSGENEGTKHPALSVCIDKKMVIRVKRLQWNFRGNQTIFVDGLLVDLLWDVHDWFFNSSNGFAVFMFRTRTGLDSRLWLEEKLPQNSKEQETLEFSLLIYASKNS